MWTRPERSRALPPDVSTAQFRAYPDEAAAQLALGGGEIARYLLVPAGYPAVDPVIVVPEFSLLLDRQREPFAYVLYYNMTGDAAAARALIDPTTNIETVSFETAVPELDLSTLIVPFLTLFVFFFLITTSSGYMLRSISREKENRTMEVLLVSLAPRELMLGKVIGLGFVALLQMGIWVGGSFLITNGLFTPRVSAAPPSLSPGFVLWALLFFLSGHFLYSALMGIVGAAAPNARETGQFPFFVMLILSIPLLMSIRIFRNPHGTLAVVLSLVPFTAPGTMMSRLALDPPPLWQPAAALGGVIVTAYLCVLLAARFARADRFLSTRPLSRRRLFHKKRPT
jgi:ABC-2 type transport system permease protein